MDMKIHYMDKGFISSLRERMRSIDMSFWIEEAWTPPLQREGDESLMERFSLIEGITTGELTMANEVRIYLRVITIADLTHPNGKYIPDEMLDGAWQSGSDLRWPEQPLPPKQH